MRLFSVAGAEHFSRQFAHSANSNQMTVSDYFTNMPPQSQRVFREGSSEFAELRDCVLRESERYLFLGASCYRRFSDLLISSSAAWALVTAYYGCWYSAHALLGMFGSSILKKYVLDVETTQPGQQTIRFRRINGSAGTRTTHKGSHQKFWDLFYSSVATLRPVVSQRLAPALSPVNGNPVWLIQKRNQFNYQAVSSIDLSSQFENLFNTSNFESTLPGSLSTVFEILKLMLTTAFDFANQFQLETDALFPLSHNITLRDAVRTFITERENYDFSAQIDVSFIT